MISRKIKFTFALIVSGGFGALAWAANSAPAATGSELKGPVIAGLCYVSRDTILTTSKVGIYGDRRLREISAEAQTEIANARKPIDAELAAFRAQVAKMPQDQARAQDKALSAKFAAVTARSQQRDREIQLTRNRVIAAILAQSESVVGAVYAQHGCGVLFDRSSVLGGNMTNDLTAQVVAGLDAKIVYFPIQRATLDPAPAPAAPTAPSQAKRP